MTAITFCFTDIEGSTQLLRSVGEEAYEALLERHRELIRTALMRAGGDEIKTEGDGFFLAFEDAAAALAFATTAQRAITDEPWPTPLRVRMGMHRGAAERRPDGDFVALAVHQAARVAAAAHGGQILATDAVTEGTSLDDDIRLERLGAFRLRDFDGAVDLAQLAGPGLPSGFPPLRATRADHGLRLPRTSLVGRERELEELGRLLLTQPLITLVGIGGVGKTRLALEAAAAAAAVFTDGLHVAELSSVPGPDLVGPTLAAAVDVRPAPGVEPLVALAAVIGSGRRLLVLDSCEHCLDGVAQAVEQLYDDCPNLVVLATSIEPIRVPHERMVAVEPLGEDAVRLVVQRAIEAGANLGPTAQELADIAEITRRLDGIPLALELAAGRITERGLPAVVASLDDLFALLTNGYRTALPCHRTLEAMVGWSVEQLKPDARDLLMQLSMLLGRWTPPAALEVCTDDRSASSSLQMLIDRSLVAVDDGPPQRIRLLDTVRAFAARTIDEGVAARVAARRLDWFVQRLADSVDEPEGELLDDIDALIADVRAALSRPDRDTRQAAILAASVAHWYDQRGLWGEAIPLVEAAIDACPAGRERSAAMAALAQLLASAGDPRRAFEVAQTVIASGDAPPRALALALLAGTSIAEPPPTDRPDPFVQALEISKPLSPPHLAARTRIALRKQILGDARGAVDDLDAVIADARDTGRFTLEAQARINRGGALIRLGELDEAERELELGRALAIEHHQRGLAAGALTNLSMVALHRGDAERALALAEERLTLAREMAEPRGKAAALGAVTTAAMALGDLDRARQSVGECRELFGALGLPDGVVTSGFNQTLLAARTGADDDAVRFALEVVADASATTNVTLHSLAVLSAGAVAARSGLVDGAALLAAAELDEPNQLLDPSDRGWLAECEADLLAAVGAEAVAAARSRGRALNLDAALVLATTALQELRLT